MALPFPFARRAWSMSIIGGMDVGGVIELSKGERFSRAQRTVATEQSGAVFAVLVILATKARMAETNDDWSGGFVTPKNLARALQAAGYGGGRAESAYSLVHKLRTSLKALLEKLMHDSSKAPIVESIRLGYRLNIDPDQVELRLIE